MKKIKCEHINFFTSTLTKNGYPAATIHDLLRSAWGEENIPSDRQIRRISSENQGNSIKVERKAGSGRPKEACTEENIEMIKAFIEENNRLSTRQLEALSMIPRTSVMRILHDCLKLKSISAKWVPYSLTNEQKVRRLEGCQVIKRAFESRNSRRNIYVCDEKWVYFKSKPHPLFIRAWLPQDGSGDSDRPTIARRTQSDRKVQVIVASNFTNQHYFEILEDGGSINSERYIQFLENAITHLDINAVRLRSILWMHDNARPHSAALTCQYLEDRGVRLLKQPAYSPDLNLMDRYIFRNFEANRKNVNFSDVNEIRRYLANFLHSLTLVHS